MVTADATAAPGAEPRAGSSSRATDARPRRTQAERREATRAKLLDATLASLAERGYAHTSTTEVCQRAGVSRGAQLHHFPTKADLVVAALGHLFARRLDDFRAAMTALPPGPGRVDAAIDLLGTLFSGDDVDAWVELVVAGRTDPELQVHVAAMADGLVATFREVWLELFPPPPDLTGEGGIGEIVPPFLLAVLEGLALSRMTGSPRAPGDADQVLAALKLLAAYFRLDQPPEDRPWP